MTVDPPSASIGFVQPGPTGSLTLTTQALRFLTNIVNALNGVSVAGVSSITLGNGVVFSSGSGNPNGSVTGSIGDLYTNMNGGSGSTFYVKESGQKSKTGWQSK